MRSVLRQPRMMVVALAMLLANGCLTLRQQELTLYPGTPARAVIFVADGAGNFQACSDSIRKSIARDKASIDVITFPWSHGYCRILADQLAARHAKAQGKRLALEVEAFAAQYPDVRIHLVGHSAGSSVVLSALENLPPGLVERAVLLSPSVSARYDVRPALRNVQLGLHVYYSRHDFWYLGLATDVLGTADRRFFQAAAGRNGFHVDTSDDLDLMLKLHQRAWQPSDGATGNFGGHFGNYQPEFLRHNLLPLVKRAKL